MPNLFPEGGNEPLYNTVDAALLFINCVYLYYQAAGDKAFVREMYPVMERIIKAYREGTDYGSIWMRRSDPVRRRAVAGNLDGRAGRRYSSHTPSRQASGNQCLLV